jgi:hypothetical protein
MDPDPVVCRDAQVIVAAVPPALSARPPSFSQGRPFDATAQVSRPEKRKTSILWGISWGTVLSVVGFLALTLYQQYNESLTELRGDLKHFNTTCADLVKKDELQTQVGILHKKARDVTDHLTDQRTRLAVVEYQLKLSEEDCRELRRQNQLLRERLAAVEGRQTSLPANTSTPPHDD